MDPISFVASIAGLLALGGSMVTLSRKLYHTAKRLKSAQKEVFKFSRDVELFADLISLAYSFLKQYLSKFKNTPLLQYMKKRRVVYNLCAQTQDIYESIAAISPDIKGLESRMGLIARLKWVRSRKIIRAFSPEMEAIKTNFNMLLLVVRLEPLFRQHSTDSDREV
jgi:hypothetical protein